MLVTRPRLFFSKFRQDESGATTVDWVVLTAAIVSLGIAVGSQVGQAAEAQADRLETCLKRTGNVMKKDWDFKKKSKIMQKRCRKS